MSLQPKPKLHFSDWLAAERESDRGLILARMRSETRDRVPRTVRAPTHGSRGRI
jgi:hypothetical protein